MPLVQFLLGLLPPSRAKNRLLSLTSRRWSIHPSARIGPTVIWRIGELLMGEGATIGTGNVFRRITRAHLGEGSMIGQLNWFSGEAAALAPDLPTAGSLTLGAHAGITSRHLIDCSGGFSLGDLATMGGHRTQVLTHGPDLEFSLVVCQPTAIGEYCLIGTSCVIVAGVTIAERIIVGAGSVVVRDLTESGHIYAGSPAVPRSDVSDREMAYFTRTRGPLLPRDVRAAMVRDQQRRL